MPSSSPEELPPEHPHPRGWHVPQAAGVILWVPAPWHGCCGNSTASALGMPPVASQLHLQAGASCALVMAKGQADTGPWDFSAQVSLSHPQSYQPGDHACVPGTARLATEDQAGYGRCCLLVVEVGGVTSILQPGGSPAQGAPFSKLSIPLRLTLLPQDTLQAATPTAAAARARGVRWLPDHTSPH